MSEALPRTARDGAHPFLVFEGDRATITVSDERLCNEERIVERVLEYALDVLDVHYVEVRVMPSKTPVPR